jgi:hypothetical protein
MGMEKAKMHGRQIGCLWLIGGGCVAIILACVIVLAAIWWYFGRWGQGDSAWERLPSSVVFAVEVHDMRGMLLHALDDPSLVLYIDEFSLYMENEFPELADFGKSFGGDKGGWKALYHIFSFFHIYFVPNLGIAAWTATGDVVVLGRFPLFSAAYMPDTEAGNVALWQDGVFVAETGNWTAFSSSETLLHEVLDNWDTPARPLGERFRASTPYAYFGYKYADGSDDASASAGTESNANGPLMLGNPFAAQTTVRRKGKALRVCLQPGDAKWTVEGDAAWSESLDAFLREPLAWRGREPVVGMRDNPLNVSVHADPELLRRVVRDISPEAESFFESHGNGMLGDVFLAATPPRWDDPYILPAPVVTVGIPLASEPAAREMAADLAALTDGIGEDVLREPLLSQVVTIKGFGDEGEGEVGRRILLPPELLNGMNPLWLVEWNDGRRNVWVSSDPEGVEKRGSMFHGEREEAAVPGMLSGGVAWNMDRVFRERVHDIVADRLSLIPDDSFPGKGTVLSIAESADTFFRLYPCGDMLYLINPASSSASFRATIPFMPGVAF